jgi:hypothetical protein
MTRCSNLGACVRACGIVLAAALSQPACAADLAGPPMQGAVPEAVPPLAYGYGAFNPFSDPRCRIVPMPELSLYGETARFRPTAVCQSRGVYADTVVLP